MEKEKVIKALETCIGCRPCKDCPFDGTVAGITNFPDCVIELQKEALSVIKELEKGTACTGLVDNNGKKIYEGDFVQFTDDPNKTKWLVVFGMNYGYGINSPGFVLKDYRNASSEFRPGKMLVVGNVKNNPEFL